MHPAFLNPFMPHGHCYLWRPDILWINVVSDVLIGLAYLSIPAGIYRFLAVRRDASFRGIFYLSIAFILSCGVSHFVGALVTWVPAYGEHGLIKAITALVSVATAVYLWRLLPVALALPSPAQLTAANEDLRAESARRTQAESKLREANAELEARVAERTKELERSNRDLAQFAYMASHDLRAPLRRTRAFAELLGADYADRLDERGLGYLHHIEQASEDMATMVSDLLSLAKIRSGPAPRQVIDPAVALHVARERLDGVLVNTLVDVDALPRVSAPRGMLPQLFQNLLGNAAKYARDEHGELRVHVHALASGSMVRFFVDDAGPGIPPDRRARALEPLGRLERDAAAEGTGMGLALCLRLVERASGELGLEDSPAGGLRVWFTLPAAPPGAGSGE